MQKILLKMCIIFSISILIDKTFAFIQKPINFDHKRVSYTKEYIYSHYGIRANNIIIHPQIIVIHWTELSTLLESFKAFQPSKLSKKDRPDLTGNLNISAHFLVDRDGTIYQLMPENWMARHVIGLNYYAIGIENVGGVQQKADLTQAQIKSNVYLICYLRKKYPKIHTIIGHSEYLHFKNTPLWLEKNSNYSNQKKDPGKNFMHEVRRLMAIYKCD